MQAIKGNIENGFRIQINADTTGVYLSWSSDNKKGASLEMTALQLQESEVSMVSAVWSSINPCRALKTTQRYDDSMIIAQQRCSCASSKSYAVPEQVIKCVEGKECLINENTVSLATRRTIILNLAVVVEGWNEPTAVGVSRAVPALPGV